jgi:hypothetical protein
VENAAGIDLRLRRVRPRTEWKAQNAEGDRVGVIRTFYDHALECGTDRVHEPRSG